MRVQKLTKSEAEEIRSVLWSDHAELYGHKYEMVDEFKAVAEYRWARVDRLILKRDDGTFWWFELERSDNEMGEAWSYIEPELVQCEPKEVVTMEWQAVGT